MRLFISYLPFFCFVFSFLEGSKELVDFSPPVSQGLETPKAWLKQLDFSGKPFVKKEKQVTLLYKNMIKHGHVQDPELIWEWGFRTGIGLNTVIKNWNLIATYTKFHTKPFSGMQAEEGIIIPTWKSADVKKKPEMGEGKLISWRLHLDLADLELGKSFAPADRVVLRPHAGVRAARIYQRTKQIRLDKDEISEKKQPLFCSNNCAGVGFRGGVDSLWTLGKGISFFSDGALSVLAGYYNIDQKKRPVQRDDQTVEKWGRRAGSIATVEGSLGIQYEKFFFNEKIFTFRMGYEVNYIFNQTRQMDQFDNAKGALSDPGNGMSLQGLTLGFRLDF